MIYCHYRDCFLSVKGMVNTIMAEKAATTQTQEEIHLVDLLYPSEDKKRVCLERGQAIAKLPQDYVTNLELEMLSRLICPENSLNALRIFTQMTADPEVLHYRPDILEVFLHVPALEAVL